MEYLGQYIESIFKDVHISWKKIILSKKIKPIFIECLRNIIIDLNQKGISDKHIAKHGLDRFLRPNIENLLEAFKYFDANNLKAIIIGQDPYPRKGHAMGLSFSTNNGVKPPPSLKNIYKCLQTQGLISNIPDNGCLKNWAKQGILMLNIYLTRSASIRVEDGVITNTSTSNTDMHKFWKPFTVELLKFLSKRFISSITHNINREIFVMLWGNEAQKLESIINTEPCKNGNKFTTLCWKHPSPMANTILDEDNFINCDHFSKVDIIWDVDYEPNWNPYNQFFLCDDVERCLSSEKRKRLLYDDGTTTDFNIRVKKILNPINSIVVCTDGSCKGNGNDDAVGSFGVHFLSEYDFATDISGNICGILQPYNIYYDEQTDSIEYTNIFRKVTSPRAELFGVLYALKYIHDNWNNPKLIVFVIDCDYVLKTLDHKIYDYYNADPNFNRANGDVIKIIYKYLWKIAKKINPNFVEVQSTISEILKCYWQKAEHDVAIKDRGNWNKYHLYGNKEADHLANYALDNSIDIMYEFDEKNI